MLAGPWENRRGGDANQERNSAKGAQVGLHDSHTTIISASVRE